jgi:hypothetical protein
VDDELRSPIFVDAKTATGESRPSPSGCRMSEAVIILQARVASTRLPARGAGIVGAHAHRPCWRGCASAVPPVLLA